MAQAYWSVPMEQSEGNMPPDCYSLDARTGIGKPGGDCHACPFAEFRSDLKAAITSPSTVTTTCVVLNKQWAGWI